GALERRTGCFELAEGGTLLLDEIGEMPVGTQAKLLRVLEDHKLRRLGSKVETSVDVRVLAATNKTPEEAVARGELRNDLYYRLNVFNIHMPALREHKEDLAELVQTLLAGMVSAYSYLYDSHLLRQRFSSASDIAQLLAQQIVYSASNAVFDMSSTKVDTDNSKAVRKAIEGYLTTDTNLNDLLDSSVGNVPIVYDAAIMDLDGRALLHSNPDLDGKILTPRPDFERLR